MKKSNVRPSAGPSKSRAWLTFAAALLCGASASAQQANPPAPEAFVLHLVSERHSRTGQGGECLIVAGNGTDMQPSRHAWGSYWTSYCGFASQAEMLANRQAVWLRHKVRLPGRSPAVAVIENRRPGETSGRCLLSDAGGDTSTPSLDRKPGGQGPYCGWTAEEIGTDLRAAWAWEAPHNQPSLVSLKTHKCLAFSNNGQDVHASMYRWPQDSSFEEGWDFCGQEGGYSELVANGQAAFSWHPIWNLPN